ncbi:MAG: HEAT repeat domain-containing protein [Myxococcota bacterium]
MPRLLPTVRSHERRNVFVATGTLFLVLAGFVLVDTARDALFLASLAPEQLPWVYLAIAGASMAVAMQVSVWSRRAVAGWLGLSAAVTAGFLPLVERGGPWVLYALYVWAGVFATLAVTRLWLLLGQFFTVTEAKRLYGLIGAGSLTGAVAGAAIARLLTTWWPPEVLLLAAAGLLALATAGPLLLSRATAAESPAPGSPDLRACVRAIAAHPFIARLGLLVVLSTVALKLVDWVFMAQVDAHVQEADLGRFFANVYIGLNLLAMLAQVMLTGVAIRKLGVQRAVLLFPMLLVLAATGILAGGGLVAALILLAVDGTLKHSLHRTAVEVLYLPIPPHLRRHAKNFFDVVGHRGSQALASLLILAVIAVGGDATWIVVGVVTLCIAWIAVGLGLRRPYLDLFRSTLREGAIETRSSLPELDLVSLEALIRALNSADDAEVLAAMNLLARAERVDLIPALILHHPSEAIVMRALDLFAEAGRTDFLSLADRLVLHGEGPVRVAALRARLTVATDPERLEALSDDPDLPVRATACVGLVASEHLDEDESRRLLERLTCADVPGAREAIAAAVAHRPHPRFAPLLLDLAGDPVPEVRAAVADAMGAVGDPAFLDVLVDMLGHRTTRPPARRALLGYGDEALAHLERALREPSLPRAVREHLPRTISRFPAEAAAPILVRHLGEEPSSMLRYKILRGLGRIRADHPEMRLDEAPVRAALDLELERAFMLLRWQQGLELGTREEPARRTVGHELLLGLVRDKLVHAVERIFRLLGLLNPYEDLERVHHGLFSPARRTRASSLELLDYVVGPRLRDPLLALVGDGDLEERLALGGDWAPPPPADYEALMEEMLCSGTGSLRGLTAYHVGELRMEHFLPHLETLAEREGEEDEPTREVLRRALELLRGHGRHEHGTRRTAHAD